jgi:5-methylcytosine-specific restriction endonuclease McrA
MKKKPPYNQNAAIRGALRRAFARSPAVQEKMAESRREVPRYRKDGTRAKKDSVQRQCEICKEWVGSTKLAVDHIDPVISVEYGFQDWNTFVKRLWCDKTNLQRICSCCHDLKTKEERIARLLKQYTEELDSLEKNIHAYIELKNSDAIKAHLHVLRKYIAKKKTTELRTIVDRALSLKEKISRYK